MGLGDVYKRQVQALGGAKNHMIVLPDADMDAAADAAVNAGYGSAGERFLAISVVVAGDPDGGDLVGAGAQGTRGIGHGRGSVSLTHLAHPDSGPWGDVVGVATSQKNKKWYQSS